MNTESRVTVVGAGLGGLTAAAVLQRHGVPVTVYDLDAGPDARPQGGMLDMHEETGQAALAAAGLDDPFRALVLPGAEATRILDRDGTLRYEDVDDGHGSRPEIQREDLRHLLLDALAPGTVRWGHKLTAVRGLGEGRHELTFADSSTVTTSVLVGADGAWSRVRPLVSAARPSYSGISFVTFRLHDADRRLPEAAAAVGPGMLFALADGRGLLAHREPGDTLEVYAAVRTGPEWLEGIDFTDDARARAAVSDRFADWAPSLRGLVDGADTELVPRPIHALPVGHRWDRTAGVTLLGDAAHLMSPFAGEGANLAMADGADLAAALVEHGVDDPAAVQEALAGYEAVLFPRSARAAAESAANLDVIFRADAPQGLVELLNSYSDQAGRAQA